MKNFSLTVKGLDHYKEISLTRKNLAARKARYETARKNIKAAELAHFPYIGIGSSWQMNHHRNLFGSGGETSS